jgi:glycosyltransferase involved in cell wall biosynthesis
MRLAIASDAWFPQVNGVVRTLAATVSELTRRGWEIELITPDRFLTVPAPGYSSIRLAVAPRFRTRKLLHAFQPEVVHIATEGPIGWSARRWCIDHGVAFTTAFHTRFPDYLAVRIGISPDRFWPLMRRFHQPGSAILAATESLRAELASRGLPHTRDWSRGIDHSLFRPDGPGHPVLERLARPVLLNVGRVSKEKNLEAFLEAPVEGSKVVVGDGPALADLRQRFPQVLFMGGLAGEELAAAYRSADCFVFPSLTDTFGLVIIEALACGVPVAAYPVPGPIDILGPEGCGISGSTSRSVGSLAPQLDHAIRSALGADRSFAASYGAGYTWERSTDQFISAVEEAVLSQGPQVRSRRPAANRQRDGKLADSRVP